MRATAGLFGLMVALLATLVLAAPAIAGPRFPDVPAGYPYSDAVYDLASRAIISGYDDGRFGPNESVTREQFAKMIVLAMGSSVTEQDLCSFPDVFHDPSSLYPYHFVAAAANRGLTNGYDDGTFRPTNRITRMQVISIVVRASGSGLSRTGRGLERSTRLLESLAWSRHPFGRGQRPSSRHL